jgi:hypothetical protein
MTTVHFVSGKQIHCDVVEIDDIKELVYDQEGIPLEEQIIQPCWGRGGSGRGRGTSNMCVSMRTMGGRQRGVGNCNNHSDLLGQAKTKGSNIGKCCNGGNPSINFTNLTGTRPNKKCAKTYNCKELGLPSGSKFDNFKQGGCDHLKLEFCNHGNHLQIYGKNHCKFCMAHNSGCSDAKKFEVCAANTNKGSAYYEECKCINTKADTDLEKKLVEYNGENLACWSKECRNPSMQTILQNNRFIPSLWWSSIAACRTPSLCIMEFNDVDIQQYGGVVNFHQSCGGGATSSGNIKTPPTAPPAQNTSTTLQTLGAESPSIPVTDSRTLLPDIDQTEIGSTIPYSVIIFGLFGFLFIFLVIQKRNMRRKVQRLQGL